MKVALADQITELERELRARAHVYPRLIDKGRLKLETAHAHNAALQAALATLRTLSEHADGIRLLIAYLKRQARLRGDEFNQDPGWDDPSPAEVDLMLQQPAVQAVLQEFPDAVLTSIRPVAYPPPQADAGANETDTEETTP